MQFLTELMKNFRRLDDETPDDDDPFKDDADQQEDPDAEQQDSPDSEQQGDDLDFSGENDTEGAEGDTDDPFAADEGDDDPNGDQQEDPTDEENPELNGLVDQTTEDPDRQGLIRTVKGAHLVYKRQIEDGTYEELWQYNIGSMRDELEVRKAILAGTDIPTNKTRSEDGSQTYKLWTAGNAELLVISGLQN